ncbi:MAG: NUDIX domain-containing protein [Chloroflexi bacterium]|nr:NUDIX domain-containing protein [Chloroflexota bacterium]
MSIVPVVSAILSNHQGQVLLQLRDDDPAIEFPNCWTVLGGHVEEGESPDEAIRRELMEEIETCPPLTYWMRYLATRGPGGSVVVNQFMYLGSLSSPIEAIPLHEGQGLAYFDAHQVKALSLAFGFQVILEYYFAVYWGR